MLGGKNTALKCPYSCFRLLVSWYCQGEKVELPGKKPLTVNALTAKQMITNITNNHHPCAKILTLKFQVSPFCFVKNIDSVTVIVLLYYFAIFEIL